MAEQSASVALAAMRDEYAKDKYMSEGRLGRHEIFWRDHQPWLKEHGYELRARYQPDWVASWIRNGGFWLDCEDAAYNTAGPSKFMDATRISDGKVVMMKKIEASRFPHEAEIGRMFSTEPLASDPKNHCAPLYDVLEVPEDPDMMILVVPLLFDCFKPDFSTIGEVVDFARQIFEGLKFMHDLRVAHCDCKSNNIMMDCPGLYPEPSHPCKPTRSRDYKRELKPRTRSQYPPRYQFIDFGLSRKYNQEETDVMENPRYGGDRTVPEFQKDDLVDPFRVDVYCIGNVIRSYIAGDGKRAPLRGFSFIESLIADMTQDDPQKRPNMTEVVSRFDEIQKRLGKWKLRSRITTRKENLVAGTFRSLIHWSGQLSLMIKGVPPIPTR